MAVAREIPKCRFCGKPIAKAVVTDDRDMPPSMRRIGDNFVRWDFFDCKCKEARKLLRERKKAAKNFDIDEYIKPRTDKTQKIND